MCSREDVKKEVEAAERRLETKIEQSYNEGVAATISGFGKELIEMNKKLDAYIKLQNERQVEVKESLVNISQLSTDDVTALKDIAQGYAGMGAMRKMILGFASVIIAIGAIVAGFITLIKSVK